MFDLATWRDIAILVLAAMWIVMLAVIILIFLKIKSTVDQLSRRVGPVLDSARQTVDTLAATATSVKGTASFINRTSVSPVIRIAAIGAAATRFVQVLFGRHSRGEQHG